MKSISPTFVADIPLPAPRKVFGVFLLAWFAFAPPAFTACEQVSIPAFDFSSWDSHGNQNRVRIKERSYPDSLVGRGPNFDWIFGSETLEVSDNVLAFEIPPLMGTIVSAELRLRLRYLVSFRGTETYQWHRVTNLVVMQQLRRTLGPNLHLDFNLGAVYGAGTVSISEPSVTIPLNDKFIETVTAAAGKNLLMGGSLASADSDPYLEQYWYLETAGSSNYATLVLTFATTNAPEIVTQPVSRTVNTGTDVDFSVAVCGAQPLSYQWRFNGANLEAGTNRVLLLAGADMAQAGDYTVTSGNAMGVVTSAVAMLEVVRMPPFFALEPPSTTVAAGDTNLYLRVLANGAPMPAYQWRLNGVALPGATNNILWFGPVTPANAGSYTVLAINSSGSVTSSPAILSVVPFFLDGPEDESLLVENGVQIGFEVSGVILPSVCRWFHDGIELTGTNGCALGFTATLADAGDYWVIASNQYGSVTSRVARISVVEAAPSFIRELESGTNTFIAGFSNQLIVAADAGPPANYFWHHDGVLIAGEHTPVLSFATVSPADAGQYLVIASNRLGQAISGPVSLAVVSAQVSVSPEQNEVEAGATVTMWAQYLGVPEVAFQWRFNGVDLIGKTNKFLVLRNLSTNQSGLYSVVAANPFGSRESEPASLEVMLFGPPTLELPAEVNARTGDFVWIVSSLFGASPACQWQFNGVNIPGATNRVLALSNVTSEDNGIYSLTASNFLGAASDSAVSNTVLTVTTPGPFDDWHSLNPQPQANPLHAITHGNGRRVAVGENGAVLVSTNGQTWTARHLGKGIHLRAVAFGNGLFVAAGHADLFSPFLGYWYWPFEIPVIFTSPDGLVWHARNLDVAGRVTSVAFGNNRFVAVGTLGEWYQGGGVALTSQDGITWEKVEWPAEAGFASWAAICFGNDRFVAVSDDGSALGPVMASSPDGMNWIISKVDPVRSYRAVGAGSGGFVAVGDQGPAFSADGVNWTAVDQFAPMAAVAYGQGTWVAAGLSGTLSLSSDGLVWQFSSLPSLHDVGALAFGDGQFTAVGDAGRILVSPNGQTWIDQCLGPDTDLFGLTQGPGLFAAVGEDAILTSPDGTNWARGNSSRKLHGAVYGNGMYVAVGKKDIILTSPDGFNWTSRYSSGSDYVERIIWANGRFVAVGEKGLIMTSTNGLNWTRLSDVTPADLEGIAYGNGLFVAVGGYFDSIGAIPIVLTSPDGLNWTDQPDVYFFGVRARGVTFANGQFVLVGNDGLTAVSTNGSTWSHGFVWYENLRSVIYAGDRFVAVGNEGFVISSSDGIDWTINRCFASMNLRDVIATPAGLMVVGSNGAILQSGEPLPTIRVRLVPGGLELNVTGGLSPDYCLQVSDDLVHWAELRTFANSGSALVIEPITSGATSRFYRVMRR